MHQHTDRIVVQSNRVTACLALHQAGITLEDIAFHLHWQVPSVPFYIHESHATLTKLLTQKAVAGAVLTTYFLSYHAYTSRLILLIPFHVITGHYFPSSSFICKRS
jgi:hypothetical protein